ncbi:glycosyltransferase family 2 protein [Vibrio sp. SM6]|uniref:Glycosyltransferase family 2 protein n=1 Tax=Vibrio agarilyticus TaxID=2726741 RepID=A0A7X8TSL3_9VIBR|nr:glycosyltransferase family 2 protein [Vibrio agarilyticus]NLS13528.1 glycosyltransferase family 2 protein [Vibrio agarilyticus]
MKIFVFVVSHGHDDYIINNADLVTLACEDGVTVCIKDNIRSPVLETHCLNNDLEYFITDNRLGFGANNNFLFNKLSHSDLICGNDYIVILNPDLTIEAKQLVDFVSELSKKGNRFATINLYKDKELSTYDNSVRRFPSLIDFVASFLFKVNKTIIDKSKIEEATSVDWCAGSFMALRADLYDQLNGFDERYYMYCEDLDLCFRAKYLFDQGLTFFPNFTAIHLAQHSNRKLLSKHFFWHLTSVAKFIILKIRLKGLLNV